MLVLLIRQSNAVVDIFLSALIAAPNDRNVMSADSTSDCFGYKAEDKIKTKADLIIVNESAWELHCCTPIVSILGL